MNIVGNFRPEFSVPDTWQMPQGLDKIEISLCGGDLEKGAESLVQRTGDVPGLIAASLGLLNCEVTLRNISKFPHIIGRLTSLSIHAEDVLFLSENASSFDSLEDVFLTDGETQIDTFVGAMKILAGTMARRSIGHRHPFGRHRL
jgi:hypothetical protein